MLGVPVSLLRKSERNRILKRRKFMLHRNFLLDPKHGDRYFFTDGCADLSHEDLTKYGIHPVTAPFVIAADGEDVDVANLNDFYRFLASDDCNPKTLKTASPSPANIENIIRGIAEATPDYVEIIYLGVSPHISAGTFNATNMAMNIFADEYPNRKFTVIDTTCVSNGMGLALQYIATYNGEDIVEYAKTVCNRIMHLFTIRNLSFAMGSGRWNAFQQLGLGAMNTMGISPNMFFPSNDKLSTAGKARGNIILDEWVRYYYANRASADGIIRIAYGHEDEEARALKFIDKLKAAGDVTDEQIQLTRVGCAIAAHTGPSVLSFFFMQKDPRPATSKDYVKPPKA